MVFIIPSQQYCNFKNILLPATDILWFRKVKVFTSLYFVKANYWKWRT
jgi:hypothetical protein